MEYLEEKKLKNLCKIKKGSKNNFWWRNEVIRKWKKLEKVCE